MLLFSAVPDLPYGYFTLLRLVIFFTSLLMIVFTLREGRKAYTWSIIFAFIALLFNPLIEVNFERETWLIIDVITAFIFFLNTFYFKLESSKALSTT